MSIKGKYITSYKEEAGIDQPTAAEDAEKESQKSPPRAQESGTRPKKRTVSEVIKAVRGSHGNLSFIAERLGINRRTLYRYRLRHPELQRVITSEEEAFADKVEDKLAALMNSGDPNVSFNAVKFFLQTKGRKRGYGDEQKVRIAGEDGPIQPIIRFGAPAGDAGQETGNNESAKG